MAEPNLNEITDTTNRQGLAREALLTSQNAMSDDFLNRYRGAVTGQERVSDMATRIGGELGLPQLQSNATMLRNTLTNLPSTYSKAVRGFDVNSNQLDRIIATKAGALAPAVATAENSLAGAQSTLDRRLGYEQIDQQKELLPFQTEQSLLSERLARETTAFDRTAESELNGLIQKIQAGITLSEGEKNRAQQLAIAEQNFQNQLKLNNEQQKSQGPQTQIIEQNGVKYLINSQTGQKIATYGSTGSGSKPTASYLTSSTVQTNPSKSTSMQSTTSQSLPSYFKPVQ